jgi:hypothetical protein
MIYKLRAALKSDIRRIKLWLDIRPKDTTAWAELHTKEAALAATYEGSHAEAH